MTARTSSGSGLFSEVVGTCVNGDTFTIQEGHEVTVDVNLSTLTTGLGASVINGIVDFKADIDTGLFMNGNLDVNGALYIANRAVMSGFTLTTGKSNVYEISRSLLCYSVEETLGNGYKNAEDELTDLAVGIENARLRELDEPEMMADVVKEFRISYRDSLTLADALAYVEENPNVFYHDTTNNKLYIHVSDSSNPSTKTITVIEPINRPTSGTESRCNIKFNATGVISNTGGGTPIIRMYGWYTQREWTQLPSDVALNDTQIPLTHDMGLQEGDKIAIGSGTEYGMPAESNKGVYTVQSNDSGTKIVTLTSALLKERLSGDYVCIASRPIKLFRSSGSNAFITSTIQDIILKGVFIGTYFIQNTGILTYSSNILISHCISGDKQFLAGVKNSIIEYSTRVGGASSSVLEGNKNDLKESISISGAQMVSGNLNNIIACVQQNVLTTPNGIIKNSILKNFQYLGLTNTSNIINCVFKGQDFLSTGSNRINLHTFSDCIFENYDDTGYLQFMQGTLYNCIFEGEGEIKEYDYEGRLSHQIIESFDHNQIPGNYKAWMRGGRIITEDNKLKFICESADAPVFKDYPILAPANRTIKQLIALTKDTPGIVTNLQIIDPANDPLIDPTASPLAESIATNTTDSQQIGVAYKSTTPRQLILRILCQNSTGEVLIDTRRIDQSLVPKKIPAPR